MGSISSNATSSKPLSPKPKQRPKQRRPTAAEKNSQKQKRKAKNDATGWDDASEVDIGGVSNVKEEHRVWNNLTDLYRISLGAHSK